ncbi:MAG: hypothetical protein ACREPP_10120 [Rhodanobacteraceae bacterium]
MIAAESAAGILAPLSRKAIQVPVRSENGMRLQADPPCEAGSVVPQILRKYGIGGIALLWAIMLTLFAVKSG